MARIRSALVSENSRAASTTSSSCRCRSRKFLPTTFQCACLPCRCRSIRSTCSCCRWSASRCEAWNGGWATCSVPVGCSRVSVMRPRQALFLDSFQTSEPCLTTSVGGTPPERNGPIGGATSRRPSLPLELEGMGGLAGAMGVHDPQQAQRFQPARVLDATEIDDRPAESAQQLGHHLLGRIVVPGDEHV